jgi:hypothetical protein
VNDLGPFNYLGVYNNSIAIENNKFNNCDRASSQGRANTSFVHNFIPSKPTLLKSNNSTIIAPFNTANNALISYYNPPALWGNNSSIKVTTMWTMANSSNTKTIGINIGTMGNTAWSTTVSNVSSYKSCVIIQNRNSQKSQMSYDLFNTTPIQYTSLDTTQLGQIAVMCQKQVASESVNLESVTIEFMPGNI